MPRNPWVPIVCVYVCVCVSARVRFEFYFNHSLLYKEASLMRSESCTNKWGENYRFTGQFGIIILAEQQQVHLWGL